MNNLLQFLKEHMLSCPSRKYLHIECPGCGFQRSLLSLFSGDLSGSFYFYPATLPILLLFAFTLLHIKLEFSFGGAVIKYLYAFIAVIVAVFYIYKIIHHKIIP